MEPQINQVFPFYYDEAQKKKGGMGVPDVLAYDKDCVLDQVRYWWTPQT